MAKYVAAIDQGTTSTRFMIFDHAGQGRLRSIKKSTSRSIPKPGWVEHDPMEIWERTAGGDQAARCRRPRSTAERHRRRRHHQPARDHGGVGPAPPASRSTTRSSGRTPAPTRSATSCRQGRRPGSLPRQDRPAAGHLLLRPEDQVAPRQRRRRAGQGRGAATLLFGNIDTWVIWNLTGGPTAACTSPMSPTPAARC